MNSIHRDIFKAIHEGKWLKIEYLNKEGRHTNYWIGIRDLDPRNKTLKVDGLHLNRCSIEGYDKIYIDSILSTEIVEGSYCPENERLIEDIALHPERYQNLFANTANLKILNYLEMCSKLDATPSYDRVMNWCAISTEIRCVTGSTSCRRNSLKRS